MPTKHRRIGVTCDEQLDRALARAKRALGDRPDAALVRELALRGADALRSGNDELMSYLVAKYGARPATRPLSELRPPAGKIDPENPTPATDALEEIREDRLP